MQVFGKMDFLTSFFKTGENGQNSQNRVFVFYICMWCGVKNGTPQMTRFRPFLASHFLMGKPRKNGNPGQTPLKKTVRLFLPKNTICPKSAKMSIFDPFPNGPDFAPILLCEPVFEVRFGPPESSHNDRLLCHFLGVAKSYHPKVTALWDAITLFFWGCHI